MEASGFSPCSSEITKVFNPYKERKKNANEILDKYNNVDLVCRADERHDHARGRDLAGNPTAKSTVYADAVAQEHDCQMEQIEGTLQATTAGSNRADRLPSRNVSFQSAEWLSVTELHSHQSYFHKADRAVRVTGVILHRHVAESDASICLLLGDPLLNHSSSAFRSFSGDAQTPRKQAISAFSNPPSGDFRTPLQSKPERATHGLEQTPKEGHQDSSSKPYYKGTCLSGHSSGKRKLVHVRKVPERNSLLLRNKRRLSFRTSAESEIGSLVCKPTLLATVNPLCHPQVADCGVGDAVMLIGEIALYDFQSSRHAQPFMNQYREQLEKNLKKSSPACDESAPQANVYYLNPRILRSVNTSNIRLQYEALLKRRAHVRQLSTNPNQPGCGPPLLYDHYDDRRDQRQLMAESCKGAT